MTSDQRRKNMQAIKSKDTSIELKLRHALWRRGLRYRKNCLTIYGKPDIAFIGAKIAVFCDSEFWHGFDWDVRKNTIQTHRDHWIPKIERNIARDTEVNKKLESDGWIVIRFWGKDIVKRTEECADRVERALKERKLRRVIDVWFFIVDD